MDEELFDIVEKMLKLEKELDKYKNQSMNKQIDSNGKKENSGDDNIINLQNNLTELENKYNEEKEKNKKLEIELEQKKKEISDLKVQITQLKYTFKQSNNNIITSNMGNIRFLNDSSNPSLDIEKYNKNLELLNNARKEITQLKSKIQKLENDKKNGESIFKCKSIGDDDNDEEEFDMAQIEEGIKKRNRSQDLTIDLPGNNETKKKYEELEERFNNLKEQVIPLLKSSGNINVTKNKATQLCELLGTSVNTTNNIMEKYNK